MEITEPPSVATRSPASAASTSPAKVTVAWPSIRSAGGTSATASVRPAGAADSGRASAAVRTALSSSAGGWACATSADTRPVQSSARLKARTGRLRAGWRTAERKSIVAPGGKDARASTGSRACRGSRAPRSVRFDARAAGVDAQPLPQGGDAASFFKRGPLQPPLPVEVEEILPGLADDRPRLDLGQVHAGALQNAQERRQRAGLVAQTGDHRGLHHTVVRRLLLGAGEHDHAREVVGVRLNV